MKKKSLLKSSILIAVLMAFLMVFAAIPAFADDPIPEGTATGVRPRSYRYEIEVNQVLNLKSELFLVNDNEEESSTRQQSFILDLTVVTLMLFL